jgi:hypothetical protein
VPCKLVDDLGEVSLAGFAAPVRAHRLIDESPAWERCSGVASVSSCESQPDVTMRSR